MAINMISAFENEPPILDFIWSGFLAGTVGALVAPGATGKSYWALEAAMSIACSISGGDLVQLSPPKTGRVIYLAGEDPAPALIRRVHSIGKHLPKEARMEIAKNLTLEPIMGKGFNIMNPNQRDNLIKDAEGSRLIILDTLNRIHQLDENSNGNMSLVVSTLERVADRTGASVLYLHHVNKGSTKSGDNDQQQAARGASALIDNVRWCGFVARMTKDEAKCLSDGYTPIGEQRRQFMRFGVSKQNHGVDIEDRWYQRHEGGVLLPVNLINFKEIVNQSNNTEITNQHEQATY